MDREIPLAEACKVIRLAVRQYAEAQGWQLWDYRLLVRPSVWDSAHIFLAAKSFKREEGFGQRSEKLLNFLHQHLDREVWNRIGGLETMTYEAWEHRGFGRRELAEVIKQVLDEKAMTPEEFEQSFREWAMQVPSPGNPAH